MSRLRHGLVVLLGASLLLATVGLPLTTPAAVIAAEAGLSELVAAFGSSMTGTPAQQRAAALSVLKRYGDYKDAVAAGQIDKTLARALDEQLVGMCQETWRDVAVKYGSGLDHVVPVGTLGHRATNPAYLPGKSDKDFIPRGAKASEAAQDFSSTFQARFDIAPGSLDVNALDPTDPSSWPGRYSAASNVEKYNTAGGNKWLASQEALSKPNLWRFDPTSGSMREVRYGSVVRTPPPALTGADALGFYSDNSKFRSLLGASVGDPRLLALKQAKYDLRNADAFRLAGGTLSEADQELLSAAQLLRNGKTDAAIGRMMAITGEMDPDRALTAYLRGMDELTGSMGRHIADTHLTLIARAVANPKLETALSNELAASLSNLPRAERLAAVEAMTERFGRSKADDIVKLADAFDRRVTWGLTHFDDAAKASFGKAYDRLTDAERSVLHGADEVAESFLGKTARMTGYAFSGYAIYTAYQQGAQHGTGTAVASAMARAVIEAMQAGVPVLAVAEVVAQLTAGAVQLGAGAYKNAVLEDLYARYAADPSNLDFLLDIQSVVAYYSGGLRQLASDLRMDDPNLTEEQIRARLADYFAQRLVSERAAAAQMDEVRRLVAWLDRSDIDLLSTSDLAAMTADDGARLAALFEAELRLRAQLDADGIPYTRDIIEGLLWHLYHPAGTPASYEAALRSLYEGFHKTWPPAGTPTACTDRPIVKSARDAAITPASSPAVGGSLLSGSGGFASKPVDEACDPPIGFGPVDVSSGGTVRVTLDGSPPAPCTWSIYNSGVGLSVEYRALIGRNEGPPQVIASGALGCEGSDTVSHLEIGAELPGPGRLRATLGSAAGSGPLSSSCYDQSGAFDVSMVTPAASAPATPGRSLAPGDRISTGDSGTAVLLVPGFATVRIRGASSVASGVGTSGEGSVGDGTCGAGEPGLTLEQGGLRSRTLPGGTPLPVAVGGRTVTPRGTDLLIEATEGGGGRVTVLEGAAVITAADGSAIEIAAGERFDWPDGGITTAEIAAGDVLAADAPFELLPLDDRTSVPYGYQSLDDGWTWLDQGDDVTLELDAPGRVELVVPAGNELWGADVSGPRLLHKVSGDFDLEADLAMSTAAQSFAITEFAIESPGSAIGVLVGQMAADGPAPDLVLFGGGITRLNGRTMLAGPDCLDAWNDPTPCPEAVDGPTRVRLSRRGDTWSHYRLEDDDWILTGRLELLLPETVWTGWASKRVAIDGLVEEKAVSTLSDLTLTSAPPGSLSPPAWERISEPVDWASVEVLEPATVEPDTWSGGETPLGTAAPGVEEQPLALALDGSAVGHVMAQSGRALLGDFEVVVRVEPGDGARGEGEAHSFELALVSVDGRDTASIGFHETPARRIMRGMLTHEGAGAGYLEMPLEGAAPTWLQVRRADGRLSASSWAGCDAVELPLGDALIEAPLYVRPVIGDEWDASVAGPFEATFTIERLADGPGLDALEPWRPPGCRAG